MPTTSTSIYNSFADPTTKLTVVAVLPPRQGEAIVEALATPSEYNLRMLDPQTGAEMAGHFVVGWARRASDGLVGIALACLGVWLVAGVAGALAATLAFAAALLRCLCRR